MMAVHRRTVNDREDQYGGREKQNGENTSAVLKPEYAAYVFHTTSIA